MSETSKSMSAPSIGKHTGRGHLVIKPCPHCLDPLSYTQRKTHVSHCASNPLITTCRWCGTSVNRRKGFRAHMEGGCPNAPPIPPNHKVCSGCQDVLPHSHYRSDPASVDGLRSECDGCRSAKAGEMRKTAEYKLKHRNNNYRANYGVTVAMVDALIEAQGGVCAACGEPPMGGPKSKNLCVDHDGSHGKRPRPEDVRGMLCGKCNSGLGLYDHSPEKLRRAADFLETCGRPLIAILAARPDLSPVPHV